MEGKYETVETYDLHAKEFVKKFEDLGVRKNDIDLAFSLCESKGSDLSVLEIGCAGGRDTEYILTKTSSYLGIDISCEFIKLAEEKVHGGSFVVADVENFSFPPDLDIVFAFASLIHVPKESLKGVLTKIYSSLNKGGVVFLSLKQSPLYQEIRQEDSLGLRTFSLYSYNDIDEIKGLFSFVYKNSVTYQNKEWMEICLRK